MLPSFNSQHLLSHERLPELGSNRAIQTANDNVLSRKKPPVLSLQSRGSIALGSASTLQKKNTQVCQYLREPQHS
jgi:hypothetical protein